MTDPLPLTGDDLRRVADATDAVDQATALQQHGILGRFEVYRPDGDDQIGWITRFEPSDPEMGWGYVPLDSSEQSR